MADLSVWNCAELCSSAGQNYVIRVLADDGVEAALGEKITWEKDGAEMMLIPGGSFEMGDHHDGMSNAPVHTHQ